MGGLVRIIVLLILDKTLLEAIASSPGPTIDYCFSSGAEAPTSENCRWVRISNSSFEFGNLGQNILQVPADRKITFLWLKCTAPHSVKWLAREQMTDIHLMPNEEDNRFHQSPWSRELYSYSQRLFIELRYRFSTKLRCQSFSDPDSVAEVYVQDRPTNVLRGLIPRSIWIQPQTGYNTKFVHQASAGAQMYHILPCDAFYFNGDFIRNLTFIRKERTVSSIRDISDGCVECLCKSICETFPCNSSNSCGKIPKLYERNYEPIENRNISSCRRNAACTRQLIKSYFERAVPGMTRGLRDCNANGVVSCEDYTWVHMKGDWWTCEERLQDLTEAIMAEKFARCLVKKKENFTILDTRPDDYDPRIGLRIKDGLDNMSSYECIFHTDQESREFTLSPYTQVRANLSYDHNIEAFRCEHNRNYDENPTMYFARCESLLDCALKREVLSPFVYSEEGWYRDECFVTLSPYRPNNGYYNNYTHGFTRCFKEYSHSGEIIGETDYFFTGLNNMKYVYSERFPPDAVILLSTRNHRPLDRGFRNAFHCKISTFVLVSNIQFAVEYNTGENELFKTGENSTIARVRNYREEYASQTTELALNVSARMVKITCYASWINSEDWAHSEVSLNGYKTSAADPKTFTPEPNTFIPEPSASTPEPKTTAREPNNSTPKPKTIAPEASDSRLEPVPYNNEASRSCYHAVACGPPMSSFFVPGKTFPMFCHLDHPDLTSERLPDDAVIQLSSRNDQPLDRRFSDAFHCKISTFVLLPNIQFVVEYNTSKEEIFKPGVVSTAARVTDLPHDMVHACQTTELALNVSASMVKITCYAPWINSENWAHSEMRLDGYKTSNPEPNYKLSVFAILGITATITVFLALVALVIVLLRKHSKAMVVIRNLTQDEVYEFHNGARNDALNDPENLAFKENLIISSSDLSIGNLVLGEGQFGIVYQGNFVNQQVAVKSCKPIADIEFFKSFLKELKVMAFIGEHPNIVRFFGAVVDNIEKGSALAVLELSPYGSLNTYLRKHSKGNKSTGMHNPKDGSSRMGIELNDVLNQPTLVSFCEQIANAMKFLAEKKVIHADLATRNVLVFEGNVVKITDFGLSRKLYSYKNYTKKTKTPLPWQWMALESLRMMEFSTQSDVWSFGVTVWEIFSLGQVPFFGSSWTTEFADQLEAGMRLSKPPLASQTVYGWMMSCWDINPENRPTFSDCERFFACLAYEG